MESYHKRERLLEEKYGKLINVKLFNDDDVGIVDTTQQKNVKQTNDGVFTVPGISKERKFKPFQGK